MYFGLLAMMEKRDNDNDDDDDDDDDDKKKFRSAGDNDQRSKRFCSNAVLPVSFT